MPLGKIEKLYIEAFTDAEMTKANQVGTKFEALINPETYSYKYKTEFCETQAPGTTGVALKFNKILPQDFNFDFLFDGTGVFKGASVLDIAIANPFDSSKDISKQIDEFKNLVLTFNSNSHRPNYLKITWGTLIFKGVLISMDIEYKLFNVDGTPLRAIAKCAFKETFSEESRTAKEDAHSPDITHERVVSASDRLSLMTNKIYNNQNYFTDVAAFNRLDSLRKVKAGERIFFPPIRK